MTESIEMSNLPLEPLPLEKKSKRVVLTPEEKKAKIAIKNRKNYEKIKDSIAETVVCTCGISIRKGNLNKHLKTKKHAAAL